jgi:hypothetical protein
MTKTLDIKPKIKDELARQAAANGRALEAHAAALLEEAIHPSAGEQPHFHPKGSASNKNLVEVCAMVRGLTDDVDFSRNRSTGRPVNLS